VSLQLPGFINEGTAGNTRGQLVGSGVWVQVAEIFKGGRKIQKLARFRKKGTVQGPAK
jgi:hypothetical protein